VASAILRNFFSWAPLGNNLNLTVRTSPFLGLEEEGVPGLVETVGYRPTGSSKKPKPPPGGTNPDTEKTQNKGELKNNQKQKYQPKDQNFKQTQPPTNTIKGET
jgi:hypothetical protein